MLPGNMLQKIVRHVANGRTHRSCRQLSVVGVAVGISTALAAAPTQAKTANTASWGLFNTAEKRSNNPQALRAWNGALMRYNRERRQHRNTSIMRAWQIFIKWARKLPPERQLHEVNRFVNRYPYRVDFYNYGRADHWATPREFFNKGGDCEDFAFVKYLTLKAIGWSESKLRVVVLVDRRMRESHAVLAVSYKGRRYVLDNKYRRVMLDKNLGHYQPVYSVNQQNWWFHRRHRPVAGTAIARKPKPAKAHSPVVRQVAEYQPLSMIDPL